MPSRVSRKITSFKVIMRGTRVCSVTCFDNANFDPVALSVGVAQGSFLDPPWMICQMTFNSATLIACWWQCIIFFLSEVEFKLNSNLTHLWRDKYTNQLIILNIKKSQFILRTALRGLLKLTLLPLTLVHISFYATLWCNLLYQMEWWWWC